MRIKIWEIFKIDRKHLPFVIEDTGFFIAADTAENACSKYDHHAMMSGELGAKEWELEKNDR